MGCDIHMYPQYKESYTYDHYWYGPEDMSGDRWYQLFGNMTDGEVRSDNRTKYSYPLRGWPEDNGIANDVNYHSHSWLTLEEFKTCFDYHKPKESPRYGAIIVLMEFWESLGLEVRLLFAFDN